MALTGDEERMQIDQNVTELNDSDSSSDDGVSSDEETSTATPIEWLATGREKRSTAGNRMKSMLAAEEPDDELELLFAEDENDAGFTDVDDDASDVHMDSSSDDEDAQENADELEGEKELEKQARERRQAARKRKAQEVIPMKFRKKVKISTATTDNSSSTAEQHKPRPKKKSERISWLPSLTDMPTRASKRGTTMLSKEQLHKQMLEREAKRLKQVEAMERKAKRLEALKKPPKTQAERLAEAAIVEKRNAKSLNRWEEAEKQREEERRAKLAALNNRTLDGPVVTFWSGVGEWVDGKLRHVGKVVTIEDKPVKKKRGSNVAHEEPAEDSKANKDSHPQEPTQDAASATPAQIPPTEAKLEGEDAAPNTENSTETRQEPVPTNANPPTDVNSDPAKTDSFQPELPAAPAKDTDKSAETPAEAPPETLPETLSDKAAGTDTTATAHNETTPSLPAGLNSQPNSQPSQPNPQPSLPSKPPEAKPSEVKSPEVRSPTTHMYTTSMFAPPQQTGLMKPPEMKSPASFLAPPAGVAQGGLSMPVIGYHSTPNNSSTALAPPGPTQRQSPLSMPQTGAFPPPTTIPPTHVSPIHTPAQAIPTQTVPIQLPSTPAPTAQALPTSAPSAPASLPSAPPQPPKAAKNTEKTPGRKRRQSSKTQGNQRSSQAHAVEQQAVALSPPPPPPPNGKAARNCIILQNFDEDAISEKSVQNRILFNRDMSRLAKPSPAPRCVITHQPARYRDPKTGLPYYNSYAYREIQKLQHGAYKWSHLVGAWMGNGSEAARGVPARFLDPTAPPPPKPAPEPAEKKEGKQEPENDAEFENDAEPEPAVVPPSEPTSTPAPSSTFVAPFDAPKEPGAPTAPLTPGAPLAQGPTDLSLPAIPANAPTTPSEQAVQSPAPAAPAPIAAVPSTVLPVSVDSGLAALKDGAPPNMIIGPCEFTTTPAAVHPTVPAVALATTPVAGAATEQRPPETAPPAAALAPTQGMDPTATATAAPVITGSELGSGS